MTAQVENGPVSAVYFLVDEDEQRVKVGRTVDTERRLREMQIGNGRKVRFLGWIPGGSREECILHESLQVHHVRGEWYALTDSVRTLIEGVCSVHRMRLDAEEEDDLLRALEATHAIVCRVHACRLRRS